MSIPLLVSPDQECLGDELYQTLWQMPLKEFVQQFEFVGSGILSGSSHHLHQAVYWAESPGLNTLHLEALIEGTHLSKAELFDIVAIEDPQFSAPYHLYGCLCKNTPDALCYLLCWSLTPLSELQRYGITLYARAVQQQHCLDRQGVNSLNIHAALQRTCHQLRTPLALMLLYADLLKTTVVDRQSLEWLENLHATAENMRVSLNYLTELATLTTRNRDHYDLRQLLAQCCQELQPWIAEKHLSVVYSAQPLWLHVNGWQMRQVLQNLLNNAIAFSPTAGQITCEWQSFQLEVVIKVSDSGPGLSLEDLRSLGTPFYSRRPGGTGLGLSIVKQIVLEHRGNMWAENLPDGGAQFCITLPRDC